MKNKCPIPDDILSPTIEHMRELALRLELEAAALARLDSGLGQELALERLRQAEEARTLFDFYASL